MGAVRHEWTLGSPNGLTQSPCLTVQITLRPLEGVDSDETQPQMREVKTSSGGGEGGHPALEPLRAMSLPDDDDFCSVSISFAAVGLPLRASSQCVRWPLSPSGGGPSKEVTIRAEAFVEDGCVAMTSALELSVLLCWQGVSSAARGGGGGGRVHDSAVAVAMLSTTAATLLREHSRASSSSSSSSGDDASKEEEGMVAIANDDGLVFVDAGAAVRLELLIHSTTCDLQPFASELIELGALAAPQALLALAAAQFHLEASGGDGVGGGGSGCASGTGRSGGSSAFQCVRIIATSEQHIECELLSLASSGGGRLTAASN